MTRYSFGTWNRYVMRRDNEIWITATPWIGDAEVKFDVADCHNQHLRFERMSRKEFDSIPCEG